MKTIKGDLILTEDTTFNESIKVEGDIKGNYNLKVIGDINCLNINCLNINCLNINCWNIDCRNINCGNIDCWNINCGNIDCWNIILCDEIKVKGKCIAKALIKDRFNIEIKEQIKENKQ